MCDRREIGWSSRSPLGNASVTSLHRRARGRWRWQMTEVLIEEGEAFRRLHTKAKRRTPRVLFGLLAALIVMLPAAITFTIGWRPLVGPRARALTARRFEPTPQRLARGAYLVNHVTACM